MADLLVVDLTAEEDKLVGNNPQDKLLAKISELRIKRETAEDKRLIKKFSGSYFNTFLVLAERHFGLSQDLLRNDEFDRGMITALENLVRKRARKWYYISSVPATFPLWFIPIAGWVLLGCLYDYEISKFNTSRKFMRSRKALEKLGINPQVFLLCSLGKGEDGK